jgi:hypothetical protein
MLEIFEDCKRTVIELKAILFILFMGGLAAFNNYCFSNSFCLSFGFVFFSSPLIGGLFCILRV